AAAVDRVGGREVRTHARLPAGPRFPTADLGALARHVVHLVGRVEHEQRTQLRARGPVAHARVEELAGILGTELAVVRYHWLEVQELADPLLRHLDGTQHAADVGQGVALRVTG